MEKHGGGAICLANQSGAAPVILDSGSEDYDGLKLNSQAYAGDIELVTGKKPDIFEVSADAENSSISLSGINTETAIIVGTTEDNLIQTLKDNEKLDPTALAAVEDEDAFDQYNIQVVEKPLDGVDQAVVITGSDKRGAAYGLYHLSQDLAGVSPWYYWGDVPVVKKDSLVFDADELETTSRKPSVKYRGIFLNDEAPSLSSWVNKFGGYNQDFYDHVYELVLRLKGNYLWPAMWSNSFSEDGTEMMDGEKDTLANARHADAWGVIMGTSHHEPMCRAGVEWGRTWNQYGTNKEWNFFTNGDAISEFWYKGAERNKDFENVITIGMRGEADSILTHPDGTPFTLKDQVEVLKKAITSQKDSLQKLGLENTPQMICLYKEVEEAWYGNSEVEGLNKWDALQNDIVMLCEDNHGNLRTLPTDEDKAFHKGGWGMYYHFDYHGGPRSYEWVDTVPLEKVWANMTMAYDYGVQDMWIVNVGDLKPMELPISYFLDMAYDFDTWGTENPNNTDDYIKQWTDKQFGGSELEEEDLNEIAGILRDYPSLSTVRKPETVASNTFSIANYNEAQRKLAQAEDLEARAEEYLEKLDNSPYKDTYYQLVYYPAAATANVYKMQLFAGLNDYYYKSGSMAANGYASLVEECVKRDKELTSYYNNTMSNGKWKGMMSSPHVGYVAWNSDGWSYPTGKYLTPADGSVMLVDTDGMEKAVKEGNIILPDFNNMEKEAYALTISNGGNETLDYEVTTDAEWINVATGQGSLSTARTLSVSVDWEKAAEAANGEDELTGTITVTSGGKTVIAQVKAVFTNTEGLDEKTFLPANGIAVANASDYANVSGDWLQLRNLGKTSDSMRMAHTTAFYENADGPSLTYKMYVPEAGNYKLTVYVGPSNNVYSSVGVRYGVSVNGGTTQIVDTISSDFTAGEGAAWSSSIMMAGRTSVTEQELETGMNSITIYGVDAGLLLEKLVLSKDDLKVSHMGPVETYYVGKDSKQQPLIHHLLEESATLPGTVQASGCENEDVTTDENGWLNAVAGGSYTYPVMVSADGSYQLGVTGKGTGEVTLSVDDKEVARMDLSENSELVLAEDLVELVKGSAKLTLTVVEDALIESIYAEKIDTEPGLPVTVFASSVAEGSSAEYSYDRKKSTSWEPASTDENAFIGLDFGENVYTDWFRLSGVFDDVISYEIQMSADGTSWDTVFEEEGAPESGVKTYIQGHKACKGSQWRVLFHGTGVEVSEMELNTYVNWALEDKETKATVENPLSSYNYRDNSLFDGDRIGSTETGAWVTNGVSKGTAIVEFGSKHKISAVNLLGLQEALRSDWKNGEGVIPDDKLTSGAVPKSYTVYYRDDAGEWVKASSVENGDEANRKVLVTAYFDSAVDTNAIKVEVGTSYWIRLIELEPVQVKKYTLDGVKDGWKNWALNENGGKIVASAGEGKAEVLNDGIRICGNDNANRWRTNQFPAYIDVELEKKIQVDTINLFGQQKADVATTPTLNMENGWSYTPVMIQYWDGNSWIVVGSITGNTNVWNQWKTDTPFTTDKVRLQYDSKVADGYLRLTEIEVYGTEASDSDPDDENPVLNYALAENGGSIKSEPAGEGNSDALIDGDISYNNGKRWRINNQAAELVITLAEEKEISQIDLISQQADNSKTDGVYPQPTVDTVTNLGIKKANIYYMNASGEWELLYEVDGDGTKVWNRIELEDPVIASQIKVEFPENAGAQGWVRMIEIQVWGKEPKDPDEKAYALNVENGTILSVAGTVIDDTEAKADEKDEVVVEADEPKEGETFDKWEVRLAPENFKIASASNAKRVTFDMPKGDVTLKATYKPVKIASASNATAVSKADPKGWAYAEQESLDDLLEDDEILTAEDKAVLEKNGDVQVILNIDRKDVKNGNAAAKEILKAHGMDEDQHQIAFFMKNSLEKKITSSGSEKTVSLATASNAARIVFSVPEDYEGLEEGDYTLLSYKADEDGYITEEIPLEWLSERQAAADELLVNGQYALAVPMFYTVTFKDYDGKILKQERVKAGSDAKGPDTDPQREGYVFVRWSKDITDITKNLTVTARYALITNDERIVKRLEDILEQLENIEDDGPVDTEKAVKKLLDQISSINYSSCPENEDVIRLLKELEEKIADLLMVPLADVRLESDILQSASVAGAIYGLEGGEGYLLITDTSLPSRLPSSVRKLANAFALDVKLYDAKGKVKAVKGLLEITFELPDDVNLDDTLTVIHYKNSISGGKIMSYELNGTELTIVTDSLSTFVIGNAVNESTEDRNERHSSSSSDGTIGNSSSFIKAAAGMWKRDEKGWWYRETNGSYPVKTWKEILNQGENKWFYFDEFGYMKTGWFTDTDGKVYYLNPEKDATEGSMITGWKLINDKWYYFNTVSDGTKGAMFSGRRTPDGNLVGADGAWIKE